MSAESKELHHYRTDQLSAAAFEAAEHEPPKEVERVDESDSWPVGRCTCCGERAPIPPMQHCCEECITYGRES